MIDQPNSFCLTQRRGNQTLEAAWDVAVSVRRLSLCRAADALFVTTRAAEPFLDSVSPVVGAC